MHNYKSQWSLSIFLPMTLAEDRDPRLDFDQTFFRRGQNYPPGEEKAGEGLLVSATQSSPWLKSF